MFNDFRGLVVPRTGIEPVTLRFSVKFPPANINDLALKIVSTRSLRAKGNLALCLTFQRCGESAPSVHCGEMK